MRHKELPQNVIAIGMKPASDYIVRGYFLHDKGEKTIELLAYDERNIPKAVHIMLRLKSRFNYIKTEYWNGKIWHRDKQPKDFYNVSMKITMERRQDGQGKTDGNGSSGQIPKTG